MLIMGLPGAGRTSLARALSQRLDAVYFNGDEFRANIARGLGLSLEDQVEQARRIGWLCNCVSEAGGAAVADLVCPTEETRAAVQPDFLIWVDRVEPDQDEDAVALFTPPAQYDLRVPGDGSLEVWADNIGALLPQRDRNKRRWDSWRTPG
ncbi:adenylyl-sulfate kinase [Methylocystis heyeri]|uniref:adenylyl-sulfate kinase n=1 Tax=Methylocystis heyeri TaxID=391905 RepID=UPI001FEA6B3E|nr:adenylyl-sulfate kinase [Methylocystis heyeri]